MKNCNAPKNQTTRGILLSACATALAVAFTVSLSQPARAADVTPPPVPANIEVPAGNTAFLEGHGVGTQNYVCVRSASSPTGVAYALFTPEATLFNDAGKQLITHFFSPNLGDPLDVNKNPGVVSDEGAIRVTWQHRDTSTVWAKVNLNDDGSIGSSSDPAFVAPGAVNWLLLKAVGAEVGPTGGDTLTPTTFIQRLNTSEGLAPSSGCDSLANLGNQAFMPYEADYFFYRKAE
jgi:hypothetical protein